MTFHLFQSSTHKSQWAATDGLSGQKLPSPHQWTYRKIVTENRIGLDAKAALAAIQAQGYYLFTVSIKFSETEVTA
jgi:hypothetical protein